MAEHTLYPQKGNREAGLVQVFADVPVTDGSGTVGTIVSRGVASVARVSAGKYTLTCDKKYQSLKSAHASLQAAAGTTYAASKGMVPIFSALDNSGANSVVQVQFYRSDTNAAADIDTSATMKFRLVFKDSVVA